jgi:hypothetical protein
MTPRESALREIIGEYEDERSRTASRLDSDLVRRTRLELAREALVEHGELAESERLEAQIHDLDHHIQASKDMLQKLDGLIVTYDRTLSKILQTGSRS